MGKKNLGIHLTKEMKDLYKDNLKTLKEERNGRHQVLERPLSPAHGLVRLKDFQ